MTSRIARARIKIALACRTVTCTLLPGGVLNEATPMFADVEARAVRNIFLHPLTCLIIVQ